MLRSRRKNKDTEGITAILSEEIGEVLAESMTARYLCDMYGSGPRAGFQAAMNKLKEGLRMFMTSGEVTALIRRIQTEWEGELTKEQYNSSETSPEE